MSTEPTRNKRYWTCINLVVLWWCFLIISSFFLTVTEMKKPSVNQIIIRKLRDMGWPWTLCGAIVHSILWALLWLFVFFCCFLNCSWFIMFYVFIKWSESCQSCLTLCDPTDYIFCPWSFPGKNTGVGCHFFLQVHESLYLYYFSDSLLL